MKKNIHTDTVQMFFEAILSLDTIEECYKFFGDVCTVNEILTLAQRFEVGSMLLEQKTYQEISKHTGASTTTISRVNRLLSDDYDGIEMAYERLKKGKEA